MYGAALLRLRESDFGEVVHSGGTSPAWPISYDQLEPYYARAEQMYSVRGTRGADPTEPPASTPFDQPPLEPEPFIASLQQDLSRLGYRPFPIPLGVRTPKRGAPLRLSAFDGYPDPTHSKSDAEVIAVEPACAHNNVSLLTGWRVERLDVGADGRSVREIVATNEGERRVFRGKVVVLAAGAINSAVLLLRSSCDAHPQGLANSSGQVGRNYMCHQNGLLVCVMDEPNPSRLQKHFGIADFYHGSPRSRSPLGLIQLMGKPDAMTLEWLASLEGGEQLRGEALESWRARTVDYFLSAEDLPDQENRVEIDASGAIRLSYTHNNTRAYELLRESCEQAMREVAALRSRRPSVFLHSRLGIGGVSHQNGTLRFGTDARTSVLDVDCRAHDLDNLYVVDASFFPSCGAVNPSLTIMANALRIAEVIATRLGASAPADLNRVARTPRPIQGGISV
jgi:choline dehydrogenase-like flavoprotein